MYQVSPYVYEGPCYYRGVFFCKKIQKIYFNFLGFFIYLLLFFIQDMEAFRHDF